MRTFEQIKEQQRRASRRYWERKRDEINARNRERYHADPDKSRNDLRNRMRKQYRQHGSYWQRQMMRAKEEARRNEAIAAGIDPATLPPLEWPEFKAESDSSLSANKQAYNEYVRQRDEIRKRGNPVDNALLRLLKKNPDLSIGALADEIGVAYMTVQRRLRSLEQRGRIKIDHKIQGRGGTKKKEVLW